MLAIVRGVPNIAMFVAPHTWLPPWAHGEERTVGRPVDGWCGERALQVP